MSVKELREKSQDELRTELHELLREQFNYRMQKGTGQLAQTHLLKQTRRTIARINTVMNEKNSGK